MIIIWCVAFVLLPALILYLCQRFAILDKIGAAVLCYLTGLIIGNIGVLPEGMGKVQENFLTFTVPVALPLLFFSIDIKRWSKVAGKAFLSFFLAAIAVLVSATVAYLLFKDRIGAESWKVAGMLIGCYTGGSPNLAAIGTALRTEPTVYVAVNVADVVVPPLYLLMAMTVLQRILLKFLAPFKNPEPDGNETNNDFGDFTSYSGILKKKIIIPLTGALFISLVIFGIGGGLSMLVPRGINMVVAILTIVTLGVLASLIPAVRRIKMTFQLGQYIILIFCIAVSSLADISKLITTAPVMMAFVAVAVFLAALVHAGLAYLCRIDADTMIITSIAAVFSPPFVPMVAAALKNKMVLVSGIITGILGWVIGTYLGIGYAYVLRALF